MVELRNNFNITNLFLTKEVSVFVGNQNFKVKVKPIKDYLDNVEWNSIYHLWTMEVDEIKKMLPMVEDSYDLIINIIFKLGFYKEYKELSSRFIAALHDVLVDMEVDWKQHQIIWKNQKKDSLIIDNEIWEYILYILKLSCGEKIDPPRQFQSEEEKEFYLAQKRYENQIKKIKQNAKSGDSDGLIKAFLLITYTFPSLTIDYLFNQTMAQIRWLQEYAAGAVSYSFNEKAMAAGNVKKGKKLDFFIK